MQRVESGRPGFKRHLINIKKFFFETLIPASNFLADAEGDAFAREWLNGCVAMLKKCGLSRKTNSECSRWP
jgi:hypothetical protein